MSFLAEIWQFLTSRKKFWLQPLLMLVEATASARFKHLAHPGFCGFPKFSVISAACHYTGQSRFMPSPPPMLNACHLTDLINPQDFAPNFGFPV
jgi:hypothetical protein